MKIHQELTGLGLIKFGFIHVTGLEASRGKEEPVKIEPQLGDRGKWDYNNGMMSIITMDGEVWLRHYSNIQIDDNPEFQALRTKLCPRGKGAFVHCSNGEGIASYALFCRVSDPYWTGPRACFSYEVPSANMTNVLCPSDLVLPQRFDAKEDVPAGTH